jgi:hypothetical protein
MTRMPGRAGILALGLGLVLGAVRSDGASAPKDPRRLDGELTPLGGQRAGNDDGTIPPWSGGLTKPWPGYKSGQPRPDPFANEKPLYRVDHSNVDEYADHLSEGMAALIRRFPSERLDVYPTHRTAAAPAYVYENTKQNVTRARTEGGGQGIAGAYGGVPFPIPQTGAEAIWNHILSFKGESARYDFSTYIVSAGQRTLTLAATLDTQGPYYYRDGKPETFDGTLGLGRLVTTAPPSRVGEALVVQEPLDQLKNDRKVWVYLVGQRRVRRTTTLSYDNPAITTSGFSLADESYLFNGAIDRYDWQLVGKKEILVPYNTQGFHTPRPEDVLGRDHLNPDHVRWELHRVWVVEATLAPGKHHVMPKRRFYLDEDSWAALLSDGWDAKGQLWHVGMAIPVLVPELPAVVVLTTAIHDLQRGGYAVSSMFNGGSRHYEVVPRRPESFFSAAALTSQGVR